MTPQERQLVAELFDRLASLENGPRDPDAERAIQEGLSRAPHAPYALVQTVLVQDEALKRANARIQELEAALGHDQPQQSQGGGFLDTVRNAMFGQRESSQPSRGGSVPSVRPGEPSGRSAWGDRYEGGQSQTMAPPGYGAPGSYAQPGYGQPGYGQPGHGQPGYGGPGFGGGGGSFLGTAAASAAGVIGGALLLNSIRGMFGGGSGGHQSAFDPGLSGGRDAPWGGGAQNSDLAREAGLDDIGGGGRSRSAAFDDSYNRQDQQAGLFGNDEQGDFDSDDTADYAGDFGGDDSDTA